MKHAPLRGFRCLPLDSSGSSGGTASAVESNMDGTPEVSRYAPSLLSFGASATPRSHQRRPPGHIPLPEDPSGEGPRGLLAPRAARGLAGCEGC